MSKATEVISEVGKVPAYTPEEIAGLMARLDLNDKALAYVLNVTPSTVRLWLHGAVEPCNTAKRLLQVLDEVPGVIEHLAARKNGD